MVAIREAAGLHGMGLLWKSKPHSGNGGAVPMTEPYRSMHTSKWFAVYTLSHHEKRVHAHLETSELETFLPLYVTNRRRKNRSTEKLQLPIFPNYVFARMVEPERIRVLRLPGVVGIVGTGREATPIPDIEIESLKLGMKGGIVIPHPFVKIGDWVRVTNGVMAGLEGVLIRQHNDVRVVINVESIGRGMAIEIDVADIEVIKSNKSLPMQ